MSEDIDQVSPEQIMDRILRAISNLAYEDAVLFNQLGIRSERNISQRFARWLDDEFPDWDVDCEYNQFFDSMNRTVKSKMVPLLMTRKPNGGFALSSEPMIRRVIPDIIVHRRRSIENLLAIEIKTSCDSREIEFDKEKLKAYRLSEYLRYRYTLFIRFQPLSGEKEIVAEMELNQ